MKHYKNSFIKNGEIYAQFRRVVADLVFGEEEPDMYNTIQKLKENKDVSSVEFVDEKIDDGCNDYEENDYVMMQSYDITYKGQEYYVRFYYGNNDEIIGTYDIN